MVEDQQQQRFQQHTFCEGALHGQQWRSGEIAFAFLVAVDRAAETEVSEIIQRVVGHDFLIVEPVDLLVGEFETLQRLEDAAGARNDTETAGCWQATTEQFEDHFAGRGSALHRSVQHGQLIHVC